MRSWRTAPGWNSRASLLVLWILWLGILWTQSAQAAPGLRQAAPAAAADSAGDEDQDEEEEAPPAMSPSAPAPHPPRSHRPVGHLLARARAYELRGDPGRARQAIGRALAVDPQSAPAMRALLWVLIEQHDRDALQRALRRFAQPARHDPLLWRGYAAGLCALGRYADALPWFARGAQLSGAAGKRAHHDRSRLWLADWTYALSRSGRTQAAARLAPLVRAELSRYVQAAGTTRHEPSPQQRLAAATLLKLRDWQFDAEFVGGQLARLRVAAEAAAATEDALADDSEEEAEDETGGEDQATDELLAEAEAESEDDQPDSQAQRPSTRDLLTGFVGYDLHALGGMLVHGPQSSVQLSLQPVELGLRASYAYLDTSQDRIKFSDSSLRYGELDLAAVVRYRPRAGFLEASFGGNLRTQRSLPTGSLRGQYDFGHGVQLGGELSANQLTEDTMALRVLGVRDRILMNGNFELVRGLYLSPELEWHGYWSRDRSSLGSGLMGFLETGYHFRWARWVLELRGSGFYERNGLPVKLPKDVCALLQGGCRKNKVGDLLSSGYATIGGGPRLRYGRWGNGATRFYGLLDVWLGALLASDVPGPTTRGRTFGYDLQLGLGVQLPRRDGRLSAGGYISNIRSGGFEGFQWGASLRYLH